MAETPSERVPKAEGSKIFTTSVLRPWGVDVDTGRRKEGTREFAKCSRSETLNPTSGRRNLTVFAPRAASNTCSFHGWESCWSFPVCANPASADSREPCLSEDLLFSTASFSPSCFGWIINAVLSFLQTLSAICNMKQASSSQKSDTITSCNFYKLQFWVISMEGRRQMSLCETHQKAA